MHQKHICPKCGRIIGSQRRHDERGRCGIAKQPAKIPGGRR